MFLFMPVIRILMTNAFVYVIGWRQADRWYAGVRYKKNCDPSDLWVSYHTSSKHVAKFRVEHGEPDVVHVVRTFGNDTQSARAFEQRLLHRMQVLHSDRWLNQAVGGEFAGRRGPHSAETRQKIREKAIGRKRKNPVSEEQIRKQKETFAKNYTPERAAARSAKQKGRVVTSVHRAKISAVLTGSKLSEETKQKIGEASKRQSKESRQRQAAKLRLKKWFTDGKNCIRSETCPAGFRPGRK
jgi:hypothetical protein